MSGGGNKTMNATSKQYEDIAKQISSGALNVAPAQSKGEQLASLVPTPGKINLNTPQISIPAYQGNNQQRLADQLSHAGGGDSGMLFSQLGQSAAANTVGGTVNNVDMVALKAKQAQEAAAAKAAADAAAAAAAAKNKKSSGGAVHVPGGVFASLYGPGVQYNGGGGGQDLRNQLLQKYIDSHR